MTDPAELQRWHENKAAHLQRTLGNVSATTVGELHRKRNELKRQAEFHASAAATVAALRALSLPREFRDGLETAAKMADEMKPAGGRMWTSEQSACFDALDHLSSAIRALLQSPKEQQQ